MIPAANDRYWSAADRPGWVPMNVWTSLTLFHMSTTLGSSRAIMTMFSAAAPAQASSPKRSRKSVADQNVRSTGRWTSPVHRARDGPARRDQSAAA